MRVNLAVKITFSLALVLIVVLSLVYCYCSSVFESTTALFSPAQVKEILLWSFVLTCGIFIAVCFLVCRYSLKYLRDLSRTAKDIAEGNLSKRIFLETGDEIGDLSKSINEMVEQMEGKVSEVIANQSRLEAVFLSMFDGVMIVDQHQNIILMNQTLKNFLHVQQESVGRKPLEIIRNVEIQQIIEEVVKQNHPLVPRELTVYVPEEKILMIHAAPVIREHKQEGGVLVFHDITEVRRLENVRRDFVANVSHELRTPVSTIKGYAETLLDGALEDKDNARNFVKIIYADSERLAQLVNDLLDLSKIESGQVKLSLTDCRLKEMIDRVVELLQKHLKERSINVVNEVDSQLLVRADDTKITQVFLNLIENAIKYNKLCGEIKISAQIKGPNIEVKVADTGIGIPEEDLPRIFERFYRVDKAHSRHLGGTGLGLSIVKHIVQIHGGEVFVESKVNEGSAFRFTLPRV